MCPTVNVTLSMCWPMISHALSVFLLWTSVQCSVTLLPCLSIIDDKSAKSKAIRLWHFVLSFNFCTKCQRYSIVCCIRYLPMQFYSRNLGFKLNLNYSISMLHCAYLPLVVLVLLAVGPSRTLCHPNILGEFRKQRQRHYTDGTPHTHNVMFGSNSYLVNHANVI